MWKRFLRSTAGRYSIAIGSTVLALLLRKLLDPILGDFGRYITLYPAIVFLAIYVGSGPCALSMFTGIFGVTYWFVQPRGSFDVNDKPYHAIATSSFLVVCACIMAVSKASRMSQTRLRRSKALFATFLDNSPGIEYLKDEAGRYLYVNRAGHTMFPADYAGKTDLDLFPESVAAQWRTNDLRALEQNKAIEFVETTPDPGGERTWLSVKFPVIDTEGRKLLGGKSIDITGIKLAEKEIAALQQERAQQSAAELEAMVRLHEVGMTCLRAGNDFKGSLNAILDAAISLTRTAKGSIHVLDRSSGALTLAAQRGFEVSFLDFFAVVGHQPSPCSTAVKTRERVMIEDVSESKILAGTPSLQVLLDAGVRAVQSTPLISSSGKLLGVICTHYEATHRPRERELRLMDLLACQAADYLERKHAEEALAASSAELRRFLEVAPSGLTRCSRNLRYLSANTAYAEIAGLSLEQIVGRPIVDVMGPDGWELIRPYVERVLSGERVEFETPLSFAAGDRRFHVVYTPEKDGQEVVGWVASITDITEFKHVEKQLREVEKRAAAGQLAASLAHEINNPLSAVINVLYLLETCSGLDPASYGLVAIANNEIARVARIVRQSLSYYRVGVVAREVDLAALIEESLQVFSDKFRHSGIAISKRITPGTSIIGFADEIRQVVDNLLVNAVEATPRGGRILLCLRQSCSWKNRSERGALLTIADNGCGIPKRYLARVFEAFFTTKEERGNGLGLWVVKGIVEKHGGNIKIRSSEAAPKSGTVISIFWPSAVKTRPTSKLERSECAA